MQPTVRTKKKTKKKSLDVIKSISDDIGNLVICRSNGKRIILSLKLIKETRMRRLGTINPKQKTFTVRRKREKHLFRKTNSYGFNVKLLEDAKLFDTVYLSDELCNWKIPKDYIIKNGNYLNFINKGGFEKQIFIKLTDIEQFKREPIV